ncbi:hypothetical protein EMIHUDRAFT_244742 [Emiliania huxleyi CCMP1516]|uniref:Hexosyltransferase n=2 Tax=Emiliania huxleyi TaxID=2903 RepID=A0A0D3IZM9_EMIH1|nr:hypothetical protein EMIHUDRAFT_244742 [Emiliania huxleyi CCMP1516]EOD16714.1 hypothetical protein EMIHUDRAFT_244742 [Emiliania huxleyi CCMP1516]|eukprot:XP_005769143.1 hypothetical protein EMIHUDRAFT_244742 [Emiliania huxleyi CCMP1516]
MCSQRRIEAGASPLKTTCHFGPRAPAPGEMPWGLALVAVVAAGQVNFFKHSQPRGDHTDASRKHLQNRGGHSDVSNSHQAPGLAPLVWSIFSSSRSPHCIHVHAFCVEAEPSPQSREAIRRVGMEITVHVVNLEQFPLLHNLSNSSAMNLVRFYLPELLPEAASSVLWLDTDIIVRSDVHDLLSKLFVGANHSKSLAAVARKKELRTITRYRPSKLGVLKAWGYNVSTVLRGDAFNAGLIAFNLQQWRAQNLTQRIEALVAALQEVGLASYAGMSLPGGMRAAPSSQVPLQLLFGHDFQRIDSCWNVGGLGTSWGNGELLPLRVWAKYSAAWWTGEVARGCALHWSGGDKPWSGHNPFAPQHYKPVRKAAIRAGYGDIFPGAAAHDGSDYGLLRNVAIFVAAPSALFYVVALRRPGPGALRAELVPQSPSVHYRGDVDTVSV